MLCKDLFPLSACLCSFVHVIESVEEGRAEQAHGERAFALYRTAVFQERIQMQIWETTQMPVYMGQSIRQIAIVSAAVS